MKGLKGFGFFMIVFLNLAAFSGPVLAAPTEITACGSISLPGSYILTQNLRVGLNSVAGDCIRIRTNFVTLDLGGFTIRGNQTVGSGITTGTARRGVTIRNGTIRQFVAGINLRAIGENVTIESVHFEANLASALTVNGTAVVRGCTFFRNGQGINVGDRSIVQGNISSFNLQRGIVVGANSIVDGNVSGSNGQNGIVVRRGSVVINNSARSNAGTGLLVTCPSNVIENTATDNLTNLTLVGGGCNNSNNVAP